VKIKCVKTLHCPVCGDKGSIQVFFNKSGEVKYARTRHYIPKGDKGYNPNLKYNFSYCKTANTTQLETLIKTAGLTLPTQQKTATAKHSLELGQVGQELMGNQTKLGQANLGLISRIKGAGSSVRTEHHPPKVGVVGSNPTPPVWTCTRYLWKNTLDKISVKQQFRVILNA
jgi:hypothetical protein